MSGVILERELSTFQSKKSELVSRALGKFALIHGDDVEIWDTYTDALHAGYDRYGIDEPFMVREIKEIETVHLVYRGYVSE